MVRLTDRNVAAAINDPTGNAGNGDGALPAALLASLAESERQSLAAACRVRRYKAGEALFHEGDPGHLLLFVRAGQVKIIQVAVDGSEITLHVCGPGEYLGELSLVDEEPRSATAVALEPVEALALTRDDFRALIDRHPRVAVAMLQRMAGMVRRLNQQLQAALSLDATGRIARKLLELAEQHGQTTPQGVDISVRFTRDQLAQTVGVARSTLSKHLSWFQERGILSLERDRIVLHRPERLRERIQ